jgi:hypothetical protein
VSRPRTDWEAVEEIGRRLYELSALGNGVPIDHEELASMASDLVRMANEETEGGAL